MFLSPFYEFWSRNYLRISEVEKVIREWFIFWWPDFQSLGPVIEFRIGDWLERSRHPGSNTRPPDGKPITFGHHRDISSILGCSESSIFTIRQYELMHWQLLVNCLWSIDLESVSVCYFHQETRFCDITLPPQNPYPLQYAVHQETRFWKLQFPLFMKSNIVFFWMVRLNLSMLSRKSWKPILGSKLIDTMP